MGTIVAAAAASHSPGITGFPDTAPEDARERYYAGMRAIAANFAAAKPDVILTVTNEHFVNFYLNNIPAICIGTAAGYYGPVEPFLRIPQGTVPGDRAFGKNLTAAAIEAGFDVAFSEELNLDHGTMVPMHFVNEGMKTPVVPVMMNNLWPPVPTPRRVYQFGKFLASAIAAMPDVRVALLATGGLSHKVGTIDAGEVNEAWDREFLDDVVNGRSAKLTGYSFMDIHSIGNGTNEVRNWICVMGAVDDAPAEVASYEPMPYEGWATGCGALIWKV